VASSFAIGVAAKDIRPSSTRFTLLLRYSYSWPIGSSHDQILTWRALSLVNERSFWHPNG
jgi:hypothetical protein